MLVAFLFLQSLVITYEVRTLFGSGVSRCRTFVVSDTDTYNYIGLCDFLKLLAVSAYLCLCPCFIGQSTICLKNSVF